MAEGRALRKFGLFVVGKPMAQKIWEADYIKLADKDKVEIYRHDEGGAIIGTLVAVVSLDKGQNVSEIAV
jgi:hypothetical protein